MGLFNAVAINLELFHTVVELVKLVASAIGQGGHLDMHLEISNDVGSAQLLLEVPWVDTSLLNEKATTG